MAFQMITFRNETDQNNHPEGIKTFRIMTFHDEKNILNNDPLEYRSVPQNLPTR